MSDFLERIYSRRTFGVKLGLHVMESMLSRLGEPHLGYPVVHVAGTNGKGSVCALTASVLATAGCRVGLYTSPHLVRFNERFRINGKNIADEDLEDLVARVEDVARDVSAEDGQDPTFFECSTCIAWEYFRQQDVDVAVIETGMGGRLDATNVSKPIVTAITRVGCEHTRYLGSTVEEIAGEKAGIIKPGVPVIIGATDPTAQDVIVKKAHDVAAPLVLVEDAVSISVTGLSLAGQKVVVESVSESYGTVQMQLLGAHQVENLATTVAVCEVAASAMGMEITRSSLRDGVSAARWPGRFSVMSEEPLIVLDGAHNEDAAKALVDTWSKLTGGLRMGLVAGMCEDKDVASFLSAFSGVAEKGWTVPLSIDRGMMPTNLLSSLKLFVSESSACDTLAEALEEARKWALAEGAGLCVTGSLFLVGDVLELQGRDGYGKGS